MTVALLRNVYFTDGSASTKCCAIPDGELNGAMVAFICGNKGWETLATLGCDLRCFFFVDLGLVLNFLRLASSWAIRLFCLALIFCLVLGMLYHVAPPTTSIRGKWVSS